MSFATRIPLLFALLAALLSAPAQAAGDGNYEVGTSLVCDTQAQVERFVALFAGDAQAAIRVVNGEEQNPTACMIMNIAYLRGAQIAMARRGDSAFAIVRILVIGVESESGIVPVHPAVHFSAFGVKEYAV
jgi:hypothetical protein